MNEVVDYYANAGLSAAFYDLICRADPTTAVDGPFYAAQLDRPGWVLELGCGTGRIVLDLARLGHNVVGIDLSASMLHRAVKKCEREPPDVLRRITLAQADMTDVEIRKSFDLVVIAYYGLAHLSPELWPAAFHNIARHLAPDGRALIHLPVRSLLEQSHMRASDEPVLSVAYDNQGNLFELTLAAQQFCDGRFEQVLDYVLKDPAGLETRRSRERLTYYDEDPRPHAAAAGLRLVDEPEVLGAGLIYRFARSGAEAQPQSGASG